MTDHNIKELHRQWDAARSKALNAAAENQKARSALDVALVARADKNFADRGIEKGSKVVGYTNYGSIVCGIFVGHEIQYSEPIPMIRKITKSGEAHKTVSPKHAWQIDKWEPFND